MVLLCVCYHRHFMAVSLQFLIFYNPIRVYFDLFGAQMNPAPHLCVSAIACVQILPRGEYCIARTKSSSCRAVECQ